MAAGSLLALFDDIATLLDDISVLSKVAVKKTAGVLGDDLAVNAEQVGNVRAERELPVVWAVAKGSLVNKVIIVPLVLLSSLFIPWLVTPVLMIGGRVKGAIRTDFILSLEIIVIALSTVQEAPFATQVMVLSVVAVGITLAVYGLVALIVKIDDLGLYMLKSANTAAQSVGNFLLWLAPALMKSLTVVGTLAMFLVGGGILSHGFDHYVELSFALSHIHIFSNAFANGLSQNLFNGVIGLFAGAVIVAVASLFHREQHQ